MARYIICSIILWLLFSPDSAAQNTNKPEAINYFDKRSMLVLPQNFYTEQLGFFCRKELAVQKLFAAPVYFRLGTKDIVDRMEGKHLRMPVRKSVGRF